MSVNLRPFRATLSLLNMKKFDGDRSGKHGGVRLFSNPILRQKPLHKRSVIPPCIIGRGEQPTETLVFDAFTPISKHFIPRVQSHLYTPASTLHDFGLLIYPIC
ncbi:hypothetical protein AVEN_84580-1 [Araneus ventricosus]|uniref:Uncharacterized protein n=1 Tax=Araneus ventricosus TaxID=182803 RepID=A0A4Y2C2U0_ARAVE|nr:hypothetical protein AVEN_84580-1 [Araneus ventricosus]